MTDKRKMLGRFRCVSDFSIKRETVWSGLLQNFPDAKGKGKGGMRLDEMCTGFVLEAGGRTC